MVIRTRDNLIEFIENNAPYPRIKRALIEGTNENLGGFYEILSPCAGWIVKIKGKLQEYIVFVMLTGLYAVEEYKIFIMKEYEIPWRYWQGDKSENPLYQGDFPEKYKELRNENE